jgi:hypothetical protein
MLCAPAVCVNVAGWLSGVFSLGWCRGCKGGGW